MLRNNYSVCIWRSDMTSSFSFIDIRNLPSLGFGNIARRRSGKHFRYWQVVLKVIPEKVFGWCGSHSNLSITESLPDRTLPINLADLKQKPRKCRQSRKISAQPYARYFLHNFNSHLTRSPPPMPFSSPHINYKFSSSIFAWLRFYFRRIIHNGSIKIRIEEIRFLWAFQFFDFNWIIGGSERFGNIKRLSGLTVTSSWPEPALIDSEACTHFSF